MKVLVKQNTILCLLLLVVGVPISWLYMEQVNVLGKIFVTKYVALMFNVNILGEILLRGFSDFRKTGMTKLSYV